MWNTCNTNYCGNGCGRNTCGCGCNGNSCSSCGTLFNSLFGNTQTVCRDCCGNLRIRNGGCCQNACTCRCRNSYCGCGSGNGNATDNAQNGNGNGNSNGNGGYTCVTFCGHGNFGAQTVQNTQTTSSCGEQYYARQYGLCRRRSCCGCGGWNAYNSYNVLNTTDDD